jgi:LDH2 family malate/lactate/ureidoglycolate dehydrogenase
MKTNETRTRVKPEKLKEFCIQAMLKCGMSEKDARVTAEILVTTDQMGTHSHGVVSLRQYLKRMRDGGLIADAEPEVISDGPCWACIDGKSVMGMVSAHKAMELAIEKARTIGMGYVTLRNGSHCGAVGYYANMAAKEGMFGLAMSGCTPIMAVTGGKGATTGNNPIAYAVPAGKEKTILFDIALSRVAAGKIVAANTVGKKIPDDWYVDAEGLPTTDPSLYPHIGALLPMAGHKGYGFAVMVEVLSAVMSGGGSLDEVGHWLFGPTSAPENLTQSMIVINVGAMMPMDQFQQRVDRMIEKIKNSPKAKGTERIYLPGEIEWERFNENQVKGIDLPDDVRIKLKGLADDMQMDIDSLFT